jgi:hypothetical protein
MYIRRLLSVALASVALLRGAENSLPTTEEAFVALVRRAFSESDPSILVELSFRELPNGKSVSIDSVRRVRAALIGRGLQSLSLDPINPSTSDIVIHRSRVRTNLPAQWKLVLLHPSGGSTTLFVGVTNGRLRTLHQEQVQAMPNKGKT